jgi:hypothetical protein
MDKIMSFKLATQISLLIFGLFVLFHLSIILGIVIFDFVPVDFLWGGRMETKDQLLGFEIISLLIMVLCFFIVLIRSEKVRLQRLMRAAVIALWILFILFLLNTIGNLLAKTTFERFLSIPTGMLAILCLRLALEKNKEIIRPNPGY